MSTRLADELRGRDVPFQDIPVVDIGSLIDGSDEQGVAAQLGTAAERVGFLYIRNHGIPQELIDLVFAETRRFFDRPLDSKMACHIGRSAAHRGYFPLFEENTDPDLTADLKEGFDIGRDLGPEAEEMRRGLPLHGPNQWPERSNGFRAAADAYFDALRGLAVTLMRGFALALDLERDYFDDKVDRPLALLRLLHYPPQTGHVVTQTMGCGAHTDYGCLTILAQDDNGGLQVRNTAGEWIAAPPVPDCFVINLGDQMARWTNGRFQATPHRVINVSGRERYSMPFFFDPNWDTEVACLPGCARPGELPRFEPVQAGPYLMSRYDATFNYRKAGAEGG